jgi:hypothetical protein
VSCANGAGGSPGAGSTGAGWGYWGSGGTGGTGGGSGGCNLTNRDTSGAIFGSAALLAALAFARRRLRS